MSFASDNWAGASDKVMDALVAANQGLAPAYGADGDTQRALALLSDFFEREVAVEFVSTGSAANALALAAGAGPAAVTFAHVDSHVACDEAGAPLFFAHGMTMATLDGAGGKFAPETLREALAHYPEGVVHFGRPRAVSIANVNEIGQVYEPAEIAALAEVARGRGLTVHMDGARFVNAMASLGVSAADLTWRSGVDVLSLGLTKVGAWCAEAVVRFTPDPDADLSARYRHKQAGQLLSKNRFVTAQFVALLTDNHALELARHGNAMARSLSEALQASPEAALALPAAANEVFAFLSPAAAGALAAHGVSAYPWSQRSAYASAPPQPGWMLHRFVASHRTQPDHVAAVAAALASTADAHALAAASG